MVLAKATFPEPGASGAVASPPGVPGANLAEDRPGAAAPSGAPAVTAEPEPPPLVRPVGEQRASGSAPRRGFWERANPARWFGSESPEDTVAEDSNAREATPETAGNRWNWARPARWFRSDEEASDAASPASPTVGGEAPPAGAPASAPLLTEPTIRVVAAESRATAAPTPAEGPPRAVATATRPAVPSAPVAPRDWPRYDYRRPAVPPPGNRAAARPVLEQAMIEHRRGRWDTAVAQYVQALRIDPASVEAYQNLAAIRLQQGDLANALVLSEAALALQPESARTRLNFALALDRAGFPLDAVEQANRILERQPGDIAAHLLLGNLYAQKLDRPAPAREHYLKVIELDPQHPESIAVRRWLAGRP